MKVKAHIAKLITRVLDGSATSVERSELEHWRSLATENNTHYLALKAIWSMAGDIGYVDQIDVDAALQKMTSGKTEAEHSRSYKIIRPILRWEVAAALLGAILLFQFLFQDASKIQSSNAAIFSAVQDTSLRLSDGSNVRLYSGAELTVSDFDLERKREVYLSGSASFDVANQMDKPFVVGMDDAFIRVLGTVFEITDHVDSTVISVSEGKVFVGLNNDKSQYRILTADMSVTLIGGVFAVKQKSLSQEVLDVVEEPKQRAVKPRKKKRLARSKRKVSRSLRFSNKLMTDVIKEINRSFGDVVVLDDNLVVDCRIDANFNKTDLETIVQSIKNVCGLESRELNGKIVLYK